MACCCQFYKGSSSLSLILESYTYCQEQTWSLLLKSWWFLKFLLEVNWDAPCNHNLFQNDHDAGTIMNIPKPTAVTLRSPDGSEKNFDKDEVLYTDESSDYGMTLEYTKISFAPYSRNSDNW